jgi:hypothetical protein
MEMDRVRKNPMMNSSEKIEHFAEHPHGQVRKDPAGAAGTGIRQHEA